MFTLNRFGSTADSGTCWVDEVSLIKIYLIKSLFVGLVGGINHYLVFLL